MHPMRKGFSQPLYILFTLLLAAVMIAGCASGGSSSPTAAATGNVPATGPGTPTGAASPAAPSGTASATVGAVSPAASATSAGATVAAPPAPTTAATATVAAGVTATSKVSGSPAPTVTAPAASAGPATVTPTTPPNVAGGTRVAVVRGAMIDTMQKLAAQYMQQNPGKKITIEEEPEGGNYDALIAAGNQPDVITVSFGTQIGHIAAAGSAIPLETMPNAQQIFSKLDPATVQKLYGHNYYMPVGADVTMLIYNKDLFKEAGLDPNKPPVTWAEFLDDAAKIDKLPARPGGVRVHGTVFWNDALTYGGWYWNLLQPMYLNANQNKCQLLNKLGTDIVFDQPQCKMADFFDFNQKAQKFAPPTMEKDFFSRTIGMWPEYGYSWEPNLKQAAGKPMVIGQDVGVAPVPVPNQGDTSYTTYGGRAYMIMKTTPERQQNAWSFIQFLMQDQNNLTFLKDLGYLPILTSLKSDSYFSDPARQPFVQALQHAVLPEQYEAADKVATAVQGVYQETAVKGSMSPQQAVTEAATKARAALQTAK